MEGEDIQGHLFMWKSASNQPAQGLSCWWTFVWVKTTFFFLFPWHMWLLMWLYVFCIIAFGQGGFRRWGSMFIYSLVFYLRVRLSWSPTNYVCWLLCWGHAVSCDRSHVTREAEQFGLWTQHWMAHSQETWFSGRKWTLTHTHSTQ